MNTVAPSVRWGIPDAVVVFLITPALIAGGFALAATGSVQERDLDLANFVLAAVFYALLAAVIVVISRRRGLGDLRADFGVWFRPVDLAIGLGLAVFLKFATAAIGVIVTVVSGQPPKSGNFVLPDDALWTVLTGVLIGSLLAPVVEELMFRGLVLRAVQYRALRGRRGLPHPQPAPQAVQWRAAVLAILISSAAFAALHLYQAPGDPTLFIVLGLSTFVVGVTHGLIAIVTGRLGAVMVSHVLFNGSGVLLQVLLRDYLPPA